MLQIIYILAFTILAFLAVANLIRNLMTLGVESQRATNGWSPHKRTTSPVPHSSLVPHPELLDATGNVINEPLLVMRSMSVEDAREQLDAIYESSPGSSSDSRDDA